MNLDESWIEKRKLCEEALVRLETQKSKDIVDVLTNAIAESDYSLVSWVLQRSLSRRNLIAWTCINAEAVLPFFEKVYPNDIRPYKAIEAARRSITNPSSTATTHVAIYANHAANAANSSFGSTPVLVASIASYAAYAAAAYAANASIVYAVYAAHIAVDDAAFTTTRKTCSLHGLKLLKEQLNVQN